MTKTGNGNLIKFKKVIDYDFRNVKNRLTFIRYKTMIQTDCKHYTN